MFPSVSIPKERFYTPSILIDVNNGSVLYNIYSIKSINSSTGISSICEISVIVNGFSLSINSNNYSDNLVFYLDVFLFGFGVNTSSPCSCFRKLMYSIMRSNNWRTGVASSCFYVS